MIEEEVIQNNDGTETFILHNVPQQQQSKQIIINNPNEIVNYTTSGAQQAQPGMSHSIIQRLQAIGLQSLNIRRNLKFGDP